MIKNLSKQEIIATLRMCADETCFNCSDCPYNTKPGQATECDNLLRDAAELLEREVS